jgi:hypothetical protein
MAAAEMALGAGFPLVAVDLGNPPLRGGRGGEAVWLRLARAARSHGAALLVGSPYRVSGTAAAAVIKAERARTVWQGGEGSPSLLDGLASSLALEKHRGRLPAEKSAGLELTVAEAPHSPKDSKDTKDGKESKSRASLPSLVSLAEWGAGRRAAGGRR